MSPSKQGRDRHLNDLSLSDDDFVRRTSGTFKGRGTHSSPQASVKKKSKAKTLVVPTITTSRRYKSSTSQQAQSRLSMNEVRPKVTAAIYLLQILSMIIQFFMELIVVVYKKFFTVPKTPKVHLSMPLKSSMRQSSSRHTTPATAKFSELKPHMPTDKTLASQVLWNYMRLDQPLQESNIILVVGNYDVRTMEHACQLWVDGWAEYIMYTAVIDSKDGKRKQAKIFESIAEMMNVPLEYVILETASNNILECITNSHRMLERLDIKPRSIILVHVPFMERLVLLTFLESWPVVGVSVVVSSPAVTLLNFPNPEVGDMEKVMQDVGEAVEFIIQYGLRAHRSIPEEVLKAFQVIRPASAKALLLHTMIIHPSTTVHDDRSKSVTRPCLPTTHTTRRPSNDGPNANTSSLRLQFSKLLVKNSSKNVK